MSKGTRRVRCPWCRRGVMLTTTGKLWRHDTPSKVGIGFQGLARPCLGQYKRPEDFK